MFAVIHADSLANSGLGPGTMWMSDDVKWDAVNYPSTPFEQLVACTFLEHLNA